jgi:hypothetical protein
VPTLFKYFGSKEDIFFSNHDELRASWSKKLAERPGTANTIDTLIAWMADEGQAIIDSDPPWHAAYLRILVLDEDLAGLLVHLDLDRRCRWSCLGAASRSSGADTREPQTIRAPEVRS